MMNLSGVTAFGIFLPSTSGLHDKAFSGLLCSPDEGTMCLPNLEEPKGGSEANVRYHNTKSLWNVQHQVAKKQCLSGRDDLANGHATGKDGI